MTKNGFIIVIGLLMIGICIGVYYQHGPIPAVMIVFANTFLLRWIKKNVK